MTTSTANREIQYREAINEAIRQEMERDESVIIMGEEIAGGAGREHLGIVDAWGGPIPHDRGTDSTVRQPAGAGHPPVGSRLCGHRHRRRFHRHAGHRRASCS